MKKSKTIYATPADPAFSTAEFPLNPELFEVQERAESQVLVMKHVELEYFPAESQRVLGDFMIDWARDRDLDLFRVEEAALEEVRKQQLIQILADRL